MSLRWRLIALYGAILVAVLVFFGVGLTYRLRATLTEGLDRELDMRARAIAGEVEIHGEQWSVESDASVMQDYRAGTGRWFIVGDAGGKTRARSAFAETSAMELPLAVGVRELLLFGRATREVCVAVARSDDEKADGPSTILIACGTLTPGIDEAIDSIVVQLWIVGPAMLVVAMAGGFLLVSRALRPIRDIAATAGRITADDLAERIAVRGDDEIARLGRTLNDTFARLQTAVERERRFTADASHELRTPLAVIAGNVELAQAKDRPAGELRELFGEVAAATARMRAIVDGLLLLARADAGAFPIEREPLSLGAIANETVRLLQPLAARRQVTVTCDADDTLVVSGDAERLRQLVTNLVDNAIRYNRPGGTVTVRVHRGANDGAELVVEDTGIGIRAEHMPRIFERFFRADPARSRAGDHTTSGGSASGGSGLGLAIAKWIATAHGGDITVASEHGKGSRFVVTLPA